MVPAPFARAAAAVALAAIAGASAHASRQTPAPTSTFSGQVRAWRENRPIPGARIGLAILSGDVVAETRTDESGRFVIEGQRPGLYEVRLLREDGHILLGHAPLPPGGVHTASLTVGGIAAGLVLDELGRPAADVTVCVLGPSRARGSLTFAAAAWGQTDRGGRFLIHRAPGSQPIAAGQYLLAAMPAGCDVGADPDSVSERLARYPPSYNPGAAAPEDAEPVMLDPAIDHPPVTIRMNPGPVTRIEGRVGPGYLNTSVTPGRVILVPPDGPVSIVRSARISREGRFAFVGLVPGTYRLIVPPQSGPDPPRWAKQTVTLAGQSVLPVPVTLAPAVGIGGVVRFGTLSEPLRGVRLFMTLNAQPHGDRADVLAMLPEPFSGIGEGGRFVMRGVMPGTYTLAMYGVSDLGLVPNTATTVDDLTGAASADFFDVPAAVEPERGLYGVLVTVTAGPSIVSGRVTDSDGRAVAGGVVTVFSADRRYWLPRGRRIGTGVTSETGDYEVTGLPEGEYLAVVQPSPRELKLDAASLAALAAGARALSIGAGTRHELHLTRNTR
jgi:hypothetical protein